MRSLLLGADQRQQIQNLCRFAADPAHWFTQARIAECFVPGDVPEYVLTLQTFRCVFTWTESSTGRMFRQLSVSIPDPMKLPGRVAVFALADAFGLTGWDLERNQGRPPQDWIVEAGRRSVIVAQLISEAEVNAAKTP